MYKEGCNENRLHTAREHKGDGEEERKKGEDNWRERWLVR
jgi:hypothetical protein